MTVVKQHPVSVHNSKSRKILPKSVKFHALKEIRYLHLKNFSKAEQLFHTDIIQTAFNVRVASPRHSNSSQLQFCYGLLLRQVIFHAVFADVSAYIVFVPILFYLHGILCNAAPSYQYLSIVPRKYMCLASYV